MNGIRVCAGAVRCGAFRQGGPAACRRRYRRGSPGGVLLPCARASAARTSVDRYIVREKPQRDAWRRDRACRARRCWRANPGGAAQARCVSHAALPPLVSEREGRGASGLCALFPSCHLPSHLVEAVAVEHLVTMRIALLRRRKNPATSGAAAEGFSSVPLCRNGTDV